MSEDLKLSSEEQNQEEECSTSNSDTVDAALAQESVKSHVVSESTQPCKVDCKFDNKDLENCKEDVTETEDPQSSLNLIELPTEVFLQICSYLSARILMQTMRLVCKRLNEILSDDFVWKSRIFKICRHEYPPLHVEEDSMNWKAACINIEEQHERWSNMQTAMKHVTWRDVHMASIDAILLINKGALCVSGSRDRFMAVFNVESCDPTPIVHTEAHKGWIWGLSPKSDAAFYTCSWDSTAKLWTLEEGKLTASDTFLNSTPLLSVACAPNLVALGSFDKHVRLWDPRCGPNPTHSYIAHRRAVLKVCMLEESGNQTAVVSISEDNTLAVWDLRASKLLKAKIVVAPQEPEVNCFPMCMSLNSDMLFIGDNKNGLHLMDARRDSPTSFQVVASYNAGHKEQSRVTGVQHGLGCVMTGSSDGTVRVSTPSHSPELIANFPTIGTEVAAMDFQHDILAVGCTNCAVELWIPNSEVPP